MGAVSRALFLFRGRADRLSFVLALVLSLVGMTAPIFLAASAGIGLEAAAQAMLRAVYPQGALALSRAALVPWAMIVVGIACGVASLWMLAATKARRIQDFGFSGWHAAWVAVLIFLGGYVPNDVASTVLDILGLAALLLLALLPGTRGGNRYGPPPGRPAAA
jgi:uncharacterized membrane protein YhaH (DUF805 family)